MTPKLRKDKIVDLKSSFDGIGVQPTSVPKIYCVLQRLTGLQRTVGKLV